MDSFNKIFKEIVIQNNLSYQGTFPECFYSEDEGLEFIFDILPTFGPQYVWHTVNDLQNIEPVVNALKNTEYNTLLGIGDGFIHSADFEQDNSNVPEVIENLRAIGNWIYELAKTIAPAEIEEEKEFGPDQECIGAVPGLVKEVRPRPYRRGLKALSLANRRKFNAKNKNIENPAELLEQPKSKTDRLNKVSDKKILQQPVTKDTVYPNQGVNRPIGSPKKEKQTFTNLVYTPSLTRLTKEAKRRCLQKLYAEEAESKKKNELEFTTNYAQEPEIKIRPQKKFDDNHKEIKKELCIVCKEYVNPKKVQDHFECPKCGLRIQKSNF